MLSRDAPNRSFYLHKIWDGPSIFTEQNRTHIHPTRAVVPFLPPAPGAEFHTAAFVSASQSLIELHGIPDKV